MRMLRIDLKALRDARKMKLRGLVITVAVAFWVAIYGGWNMGRESYLYSFDKIRHDLRVAALQVLTDPLQQEEVPHLHDIPGVETYEKRLLIRANLALPSGRSLPAVVILRDFGEPSGINNLRILQGENLYEGDAHAIIPGVLIDRTLAQVHGFKVGDTITVTLSGIERDMDVKGIVLSPEFIYPTADPSMDIPARGSLGIIYCGMAEAQRLFGYPLYNNFAFMFVPNADALAQEMMIKERFSAMGLEAFVPIRESFDQKLMNAASRLNSQLGPILYLNLGVALIAILYINIYRMIEEKRRETGILLAMGDTKKRVLFYYVKVMIPYVLLGSIAGFCLSFAMNAVLSAAVLEQIDLPELHLIHIPWMAVKGILYCVALSMFAVVGFSLMGLRITPVEAIRGGRFSSRTLPSWAFSLEGAGHHCLRTSLYVRYAFRGLVRRNNLTLLTIFSVSMALALSVSFSILATSTGKTLRHFFERDRWDVQLQFAMPLGADDIRQILAAGVIEEFEGYTKGAASIELDTTRIFGQVIGIEATSRMRTLDLVAGRGFSDRNAQEIILNSNQWKHVDPAVGQSVVVRAANGKHRMTLVGMADEVTTAIEYAYLPIGTAQRVLAQEDRYTGGWAITRTDAEAVKQVLYRKDLICMVLHKNEIKDIIDEFIFIFRAGILTVISFSIILIPVFLFSSMGLSILERERDYVILRSMGARSSDISRILYTEAGTIGLLATLLSIPMAILLGSIQTRLGSHIFYTIDTYLMVADFVFVLLCFPLFVLVPLIYSRRIGKLDIARKLRERIA